MIVSTFENLPKLVGSETGVSDWIEISQDRIDAFADATGDRQWIHVNVARAKTEMPDGKTIAHGFLTLSLIPLLTEGFLEITGITRGLNYGLDTVRFINPVQVGSRIRARSRLKSVSPKGDGLMLASDITIDVEGLEKPACVAVHRTIVFR